MYSSPNEAPDPKDRAAMFPRPDAEILSIKVVDTESGEEVNSVGDQWRTACQRPYSYRRLLPITTTRMSSTKVDTFAPVTLVEICGEKASFYKIIGRVKDIINRGGIKISPIELDTALEAHPDIAEAAVCAYPDERLGEKICACLVMKSGVDLMTLETMQKYLLEMGLAKFKLPERIEALDELPRNPLGKVQRFTLQERMST